MSKILVTGADGFTGRHMTELLLGEGHEVHGLMRNVSHKTLNSRILAHQCDLQDKDRLFDIIAKEKPNKILHLAAISFVAHGNADAIYLTNIVGTRNLLEAIAGSPVSPEAVLLVSSANIYGNQRIAAIDESVPPEPVNDYSVSKLAMEYLAGLYRERLPLLIVRPFNYTGVGQSTNFLIPKIIDHVRRRASRIELGNIDIERDWSDVRMIVQTYSRLLANPDALGKTINVCSGRATSLRGMISLACQLAGHHMEIDVNTAFIRPNEVKSLCGDNQLLRNLIGRLPDYPIDETLSWMLATNTSAA